MTQDITLKQMEELSDKIQKQREACDAKSEELKAENGKLAALELAMMEALKAHDMTSYKSSIGTLSIIHRTSFTTPKTPEDKAAFFEYLKEKGVFDQLISVASPTLNSFCKGELDQAIEEGRALDFKIPGIGEPKMFETIGFRKAK